MILSHIVDVRQKEIPQVKYSEVLWEMFTVWCFCDSQLQHVNTRWKHPASTASHCPAREPFFKAPYIFSTSIHLMVESMVYTLLRAIIQLGRHPQVESI